MKTLKMGCKVIMLALVMLVVLGCKDAYAYATSTETVLKLDENEKAGTLVTKLGVAKNCFKNLEHSAMADVEAFVELLRWSVKSEYGLVFDVDTTDSSVDYIIVTMKFENIDELNQKLDKMYNETRKLNVQAKNMAALNALYTACFDSKDYSKELAKLIQKDGYACSADDEWISILAYRMLTGQNVNSMDDIYFSQENIFTEDFANVSVTEDFGLGLEKTEKGYYSIYAGVVNVISHYIDGVVDYYAGGFYHIAQLQSKLYAHVDEVVYQQFLDTYYNDINIAYVMNSCFPKVTDMAEIDADVLLSKLEISASKQKTSIMDMYANKIDIDEFYNYPQDLTDSSTKYNDFKLCIGDKVYIDNFAVENGADSFNFKSMLEDAAKEAVEDTKSVNKTVDADDTPKTADGLQLYILAGIALLAMAGIGMTSVIKRRKMCI